MFIKRCYSTKQDVRRYYYQLVESYRQKNKVKHRVIANLGPLSIEKIDSLIKSLIRFKKDQNKTRRQR
jgi:hypothetical protein